MTFTKEVASKLRKIREIRGLTQEYLAQELDISHRHYHRLETGELDIKLSLLESACKVMKIEPFQLFGFDERFVFEHCSNGVGKNITVNNIPDNVLKMLELRIETLEKELKHFRG